MRVTKAIREWIEQKIAEKFDPIIESIGADYEQEKEQVLEGLNAICERANEEARKYLADKGFAFCSYKTRCRDIDNDWHQRQYFTSYEPDPTRKAFTLCNRPDNAVKANEISERKNKLLEQKQYMIKKIAFDLEVGETNKEQIESVIGDITIEE